MHAHLHKLLKFCMRRKWSACVLIAGWAASDHDGERELGSQERASWLCSDLEPGSRQAPFTAVLRLKVAQRSLYASIVSGICEVMGAA